MRNRNIALAQAKPSASVPANQRDRTQSQNRNGRNQGRQAREHHIHQDRVAGCLDGEPSVSREDTIRAHRVRPYHGRVGVFIYSRQTIRAYDPVTLVIVAFLLGMLIGFMAYYSAYMDSVIAYGQRALGW